MLVMCLSDKSHSEHGKGMVEYVQRKKMEVSL